MTGGLDPQIEARIRESFARQSLMATLGADLVALAPGRCEIAAPILPGARQQHGYGHAGLTFSIADSAAGYAALSMMGPGAEVLSVEMKINMLAPAQGARLLAIGTVAKPGRRLMVVQAEVWAEEGAERKRIALVQGTMIPV